MVKIVQYFRRIFGTNKETKESFLFIILVEIIIILRFVNCVIVSVAEVALGKK